MTDSRLAEIYRRYIDCLNTQNWEELGRYLDDTVSYNGQRIGLEAYRQARQDEFRSIPDLYFNIHLLTADEAMVAARLIFDITPQAEFLGLPVNGRRVSFAENVFYTFAGDKITDVWSIVDKAAVEAQLGVA